MASSIITRTEAKAQGLTRFFTGAPCRHGHICERHVWDGKCRACTAAIASIGRKRRWAADSSKVKAASARWREANPEKWRESNRLSKAANQKKYNESQKADYAENPEKYLAAARAYYVRNQAKMVERAAAQWRTRRAQANGSSGPHHTVAEAKAILVAQGYRCVYCLSDLKRKKRHLDHIISLSRGGANDKTNLQWLCQRCNCSKRARDPIEFAQSLGLLL